MVSWALFDRTEFSLLLRHHPGGRWDRGVGVSRPSPRSCRRVRLGTRPGELSSRASKGSGRRRKGFTWTRPGGGGADDLPSNPKIVSMDRRENIGEELLLQTSVRPLTGGRSGPLVRTTPPRGRTLSFRPVGVENTFSPATCSPLLVCGSARRWDVVQVPRVRH